MIKNNFGDDPQFNVLPLEPETLLRNHKDIIAYCTGPGHGDNAVYIAHCLRLFPELLEACEAMLVLVRKSSRHYISNDESKAMELARKVIVRAKGESE